MERPTPDLFRRAGEEEEPDRDDLLRRARVLVDVQRWPEALGTIQDLTDLNPQDAEAWQLAAEAFTGLGDPERAGRAADLAVQADPYSPEGHLWKCRTLMAKDEKAAAAQAARDALELTHYDLASRRMLVETLLAAGQTAEAAVEVAPLVNAFPQDPDVLALQADVFRLQKQDSTAMAWYEGALARDRDCTRAWAGEGELHKSGGRKQLAAEAFYQAARTSPQNTEYRARFVEAMDGLIDDSGGSYLIGIANTVLFIVPLTCLGLSPLFALPLLALGIWAGRQFRGMFVESFLRGKPPHLAEHYRRVKPLQAREDAANCRWGCGFLLGVAAVIAGIVFVTRTRLWETLGRTAVIACVVGPWIWRLLVPRGRPRPEAVPFRFPGEAGAEAERPAPDEEPINIAWRQLWSRKPAEAKKTLTAVLSEDPEDEGALTMFGITCLALKDTETARTTAEHARSLDPEISGAHAVVWLSLAVEGRVEEACADARQDDEVLSQALDLLVDIATLMRLLGRQETSQAALHLLKELAPHSPEAHAARGYAALEEKRWADAEAAYRDALALEADSADLLTGLGAALSGRGRVREAWSLWNRALRQDPTAEWPLASLRSHQTRAVFAVTLLTALALGVAGMLPTLLGRPRNDWMPWATFAGPFLTAGIALPVSWIARGVIAPVMREVRGWDWSADVLVGGGLGAALLLCLHSVQAWLELLMHPALFPFRWQGAATITVLAIWVSVGLYRLLFCQGSSEE